MNVKVLFITVTLLIVLAGLVGLVVKVLSTISPQPEENNYVFPEGEGTTEGSTIIVPTRTGGAALVNDIRQLPETESLGDENYGIHSNEAASAYDIVFFGGDNSYLITLYEEPFGSARTMAEEELLLKLGVSEEVLCTLNVRVSIPLSISETYGAKELGLSFCPGAVSLP